MAMMSARPTAASAAANAITNTANTWPPTPVTYEPVVPPTSSVYAGVTYRHNATAWTLTALSMSSTPISTLTAFLRVSAPNRPTANRPAATIRYHHSGMDVIAHSLLTPQSR